MDKTVIVISFDSSDWPKENVEFVNSRLALIVAKTFQHWNREVCIDVVNTPISDKLLKLLSVLEKTKTSN
jgi:hypothetical protein